MAARGRIDLHRGFGVWAKYTGLELQAIEQGLFVDFILSGIAEVGDALLLCQGPEDALSRTERF